MRNTPPFLCAVFSLLHGFLSRFVCCHAAVHQHVMGVLNLLGGVAAEKKWRLWPPNATSSGGDAPGAITIHQSSGDVLWLPPGWYHQVETTKVGTQVETTKVGTDPAQANDEPKSKRRRRATRAQTAERDIILQSWVMWCVPRKMALEAGFAAVSAKVIEGQSYGGNRSLTSVPTRQALHGLFSNWAVGNSWELVGNSWELVL